MSGIFRRLIEVYSDALEHRLNPVYRVRSFTGMDRNGLTDSLSPTGSALARTDLSPLTNGIWEIHAGCSCFLHLQLLAKIG